MQQPSVLNDDAIEIATDGLLRAAGLDGGFSLRPLPGGANNRVFRVERDGCPVLLKAYFQDPEDRRDRLGAEYAFTAFAWESGLRVLPQPLAQDPEHRLGLYEFIEGRKLHPHEIDAGMIGQAMMFLMEVNRHRHLPAAQALRTASEAYFTLAGHLECIERRLHGLAGIKCASEIDREAASFVQDELVPAWRGVRSRVERRAPALGIDPDMELPQADRRLSPSDFGFHNAIRTDGGCLRFIDFEYAGWDDLAKTVSDFFCQVAAPVPAGYLAEVVETLAAGQSEPLRFRARVALLLPVYQVKWGCIVLNEFIKVGGNRRRFAGAAPEAKKATQLEKARRILQHLTDNPPADGKDSYA
jgi:Phosphotransferase enzyme family